jgi:hypothetical protein
MNRPRYRHRWTGVECVVYRRRGWWIELMSVWTYRVWRVPARLLRRDYDPSFDRFNEFP